MNALDAFLETVSRDAALDRDDVRRGDALPVAPRATPRSLTLLITECTCECGNVIRNVNPAVNVCYAANENSIHYARRSLERYGMLPREKKVLTRRIPFCEKCF